MAKKKKTEVTVTEEVNPLAEAFERVKTELENTKGDEFSSVVIVGVRPDNSIGLRTTVGNFELVQYLLHRSSFELFLTQRESENRAKQEV